jgi:hypothetical protein
MSLRDSLGYEGVLIQSESQCAGAVLMVRPAAFGWNAETAASNRFQEAGGDESVPVRALAEFDGLVAALRSEGVQVCVAADTPEPRKPDAVFPNNWVTFQSDGTLVLFPMQAANRRLERRQEIVDQVQRELGYPVRRVLDLTHHEKAGRFLEGTGSLVIDHRERVAYACRSPRTDESLAREWAGATGHELVLFDATDAGGTPIYHTNVMLSIGSRYALAVLESIALADRAQVAERLRAGGQRELVEIGHAQMQGFAGNMLEVGSWDEHLGDCQILVMSRTARRSLEPGQYSRLCACVDSVLAVPIDVIERHGGGSVRCMLAEVFNQPPRA